MYYILILAALPPTIAYPNLVPNTNTTSHTSNTNPTNPTNPPTCAIATPPNANIAPPPPPPPPCQTAYPSSLRIMNSRYPSFDTAPLHSATQFFMLLRQTSETFQIATQVQFASLAPRDASQTCRLEVLVPTDALQTVQGPNPVVSVYKVERNVSGPVNWDTYEGRDGDEGVGVFGSVDASLRGLEETRGQGGVAVVGETVCNETLTFQMGMAFDGGGGVNYWGFGEVVPPAWPEQGWRIVFC